MRIISKFRDYYDIGSSVGVDMQNVYHRVTKKIPMIGKFPKSVPGSGYENNNYMAGAILGFCGKRYAMVSVSPHIRDVSEDRFVLFANPNNALNYVIDGIRKQMTYVNKVIIQRVVDQFNEDKKAFWAREAATVHSFKRFAEETENFPDNELFHRIKAPIYLALYGCTGPCKNLIVNPQLKPMGFASVVDPFTAFQEVSMFMGGVLGRQENAPQITDDVVLLESKGFDKKTSFRTVSPGKKMRNK